jgi:DNA-directed RNA polymerase specialized sigma24 family protein
MNTQCGAAVSLTDSSVHLSSARYRRGQVSHASQPSRRKQIDSRLNLTAFERFLYWLGPDPETAGRKYESIRGRLIVMFRARRCVFAEDLADATFERVVRKLPVLTTELTGDPARYFYGVAKKILMEHQREITANRWRSGCSLPTNTDNQDLENMLKQLDEALSTIPKSDRELILEYYTGSGQSKINHRRALAEQFGLQPGALRLRVFRIRKEIKSYMSLHRGSSHHGQ